MMYQQYREDGTTTKQMREAPEGSLYIWCSNTLDYPKTLAKNLGRSDLRIVGLGFLDDTRWAGREFAGVVLDHAVIEHWDHNQLYNFNRLNSYVRRVK